LYASGGHRWHERCGDVRIAERALAQARVGELEVARRDRRDQEPADQDPLVIAHDADLLLGQAPPARDVRGRLGAEQERPGAPRDLGRVHRVVVVRVHGEDDREVRDGVAREPALDRADVGRDLPAEQRERLRAREPAVGHPGGLAVGEHQRRGAGPAHGDRAGRDLLARGHRPRGIDGRRIVGREHVPGGRA
jgi:hypothetical protein